MLKKSLKVCAFIGLFLSNQAHGFGFNVTDGTKIGTTLIVGSLVAALGWNKVINVSQSQGEISPTWAKYIKGYGALRTLAVIGLGVKMFSGPSISPSVSLSHNIIAVNVMCQLPGMLEWMGGYVAYNALSRNFLSK